MNKKRCPWLLASVGVLASINVKMLSLSHPHQKTGLVFRTGKLPYLTWSYHPGLRVHKLYYKRPKAISGFKGSGVNARGRIFPPRWRSMDPSTSCIKRGGASCVTRAPTQFRRYRTYESIARGSWESGRSFNNTNRL
ncbi:hypothetical protein F4802DRAFT_164579 [Xylaria palmicola]|nr:hypothetical protein F4802DRAFT_164579 [Xylaria palmicola]